MKTIDYIIIGIILLAVLWAINSIRKNKGSCGCGCSEGCSSCKNKCHKA